MKGIKSVVLPLLFVSVIALFSFSGCAGDGAGAAPAGPTSAVENEMSQAELQAIISGTAASQEEINTYRFDMDLDMMTEVIGGYEQGKMTVFGRSSGGTNLVSLQGQVNMEASITTEGFAEQNGTQDFLYDIYIFPEWTYMRMEVPGMGEQWIKMSTTQEMETNFNTNMVDQQMELLVSAMELKLLRYEDVDGAECYVISIVPDTEQFMQWIAQQQGSTQDVDWEAMVMYTDAFKKLTYLCYIAKDTGILKRIIIEMEMEFTPEQAGASASEFDTMTIIINMDMTLYDYNEPFSIVLPEEAENAIEMSEDIFM